MKPKVEKPKYYDIDSSNLHDGKRIRPSSDQNKTNMAVKRSSDIGHQDHEPDKKRPKHSKTETEIPPKKIKAETVSQKFRKKSHFRTPPSQRRFNPNGAVNEHLGMILKSKLEPKLETNLRGWRQLNIRIFSFFSNF